MHGIPQSCSVWEINWWLIFSLQDIVKGKKAWEPTNHFLEITLYYRCPQVTAFRLVTIQNYIAALKKMIYDYFQYL